MIKAITTTRYIDDETQQEYVFMPLDDTIIIEDTEKGHKVKYLTQDEQPTSPDEDGDRYVFLVHYHRDFQIERETVPAEILGQWYNGEKPEELDKYHVFAVSALIHSGVWLSLSKKFVFDPGGWDTSHVGASCVTRKEFGSGGVEFEHTRDEAETIAKSLLDTWNQYLQGDVYCCVVEHSEGGKQVGYDVVGGFYGLDYARECLKNEF